MHLKVDCLGIGSDNRALTWFGPGDFAGTTLYGEFQPSTAPGLLLIREGQSASITLRRKSQAFDNPMHWDWVRLL